MEWVLQLVDEIDDAIGAARHGWLGLNAQFEVLFGSVTAVAAGYILRMRGARLPARS